MFHKFVMLQQLVIFELDLGQVVQQWEMHLVLQGFSRIDIMSTIYYLYII